MKDVLGIGGVCLQGAQIRRSSGLGINEHLGLDVDDYGAVTFRENADGSLPGPKRQLKPSGRLSSPIPVL